MNSIITFEDDMPSEITLTEAELYKYWDDIVDQDASMPAEYARHLFVEEFKRNSLPSINDSDLHFKTKGWKVTISKTLLKTIILAPTLVGILSYIGMTDLPGAIITSLVPIIFDIEHVQLSKKEQEILLKLPLNKKNKEFKTTDEWYFNLPTEIRKQINQLDFINFMEKFVLAGFARVNEKDKYLIFTEGKNIFKVSFE